MFKLTVKDLITKEHRAAIKPFYKGAAMLERERKKKKTAKAWANFMAKHKIEE